jgi:hypothetical protein
VVVLSTVTAGSPAAGAVRVEGAAGAAGAAGPEAVWA